ncbi:MAG: type I secretion system permease/ATPase [Cypionkella sp.]
MSTARGRAQGTTQGIVVIDAYKAAFRRLRSIFVVVALFSSIINVLMLTGSIYMLQVYDRVLSSGSVPTLVGLFSIVVVLYVFLAYYDYLRSHTLGQAAIRLDRLTSAPTILAWIKSGLDKQAGAPKGAQPLRDLETVRGFFSGPTISALFDVPFVPLYLFILFAIHPYLGWLTIAGSAVVAVLAVTGWLASRGSIGRSMALEGMEREFSDWSRREAEVIHAMGMERAISQRWLEIHQATLFAGQNGRQFAQLLTSVSKAFRMLLQSAILTMGAYLVLKGEMSGGMIIASSILSGRALGPMDQIIGQWRSIGRAAEAHRRLQAFFADSLAEKQVMDLPKISGQLSVSGLTKLAPARAGGERGRILSQISFSLEPGDALGVIGNSAAGKSTLARVLIGAAKAEAGDVRLDGATLDQFDPITLGAQIGYLPQAVSMLPGTIRDNIARFDAQARSAEVIAAAQLAGVHEMILGLPEGYGTQMGGVDAPLSGGQLQRLGLARALYGMPKLVVLDEPNSNLDAEGDNALSQAILALRDAGSVVIVMAHRPSAISAVNKVMILHAGAIARFGDKADILVPANAEPRQLSAPQKDIGLQDTGRATGRGAQDVIVFPPPIPIAIFDTEGHIGPQRPGAGQTSPAHLEMAANTEFVSKHAQLFKIARSLEIQA